VAGLLAGVEAQQAKRERAERAAEDLIRRRG
jgi:hypothetical protein